MDHSYMEMIKIFTGISESGWNTEESYKLQLRALDKVERWNCNWSDCFCPILLRKYFSYVQIYQQNMCVPSSFPLKYNATSLEKVLLVVEYTHIYFDVYILIKL